jgi:hypothetical protein
VAQVGRHINDDLMTNKRRVWFSLAHYFNKHRSAQHLHFVQPERSPLCLRNNFYRYAGCCVKTTQENKLKVWSLLRCVFVVITFKFDAGEWRASWMSARTTEGLS